MTKKIFLVFTAVALLAAACNSSQQASLDSSLGQEQPTAETSPKAEGLAQTQAQIAASVKVNNTDDAVNLLEKNSADEQAQTAGSDDSDLTASDSADLSSFTEVSNGY